MNKLLALIVLIPIVVLSAEPSVYGAGNLDSENPYGLSASEKKIVQNSKSVKSLEKQIKMMQLNYNHLQEKLDGTRSVTESISDKIGKIDSKISDVVGNDNNKSITLENLQNEIDELKQQLSDNITLQNENQDKIKSVLAELSSLIDSINTNYVSKDEFNKLIKKRSVKNSISGKSGAQLSREADKFFKNKSYKNATIRFKKLVSMRYKPARSNFKLGEISYFQKKYNQAIVYYKKSIALYDKASYIPTLLYHTGISLSKLKKNKEASSFFNALKSNYPNSKEAKSLKQ